MKCQCSCHVNPVRDTHVSSWGSVIWCCSAPFSSDPPELPPPVLIRNELVEVRPMKIPVGSLFYFDLKYPGPEARRATNLERSLMDCVREFWSGKK